MQLSLSPEQQLLRDSVERFLRDNYDFAARQRRLRTGESDAALWQRFGEFGWLAAGLPETAGGLGGDAEAAIILQAFGRHLVIEPYLGTAVLAAQAILAVAGQEDAMLVGLAEARLRPALAHWERGAECPGWLPRTVASRGADGSWMLGGHKSCILGGDTAGLLLVSARTGDGVSLFALPPDAPGVSLKHARMVDSRVATELELRSVTLPAAALIGPQGGAQPGLDRAMDVAIIGLCAESVGAMEAAFELTRDYLRTRRQFGALLAEFQVLRHRLADMFLELDVARSMLLHGLAALREQQAEARRRAVSAAKHRIGRAARFVCGQAIQLHGGIGMTEEHAVGHYFKRIVMQDALFGSPALHLRRAAGLA